MYNKKQILLVFMFMLVMISCSVNRIKKVEAIQLTSNNQGHCINSTQSFSPNGQWIVYDSRNYDSLLAEAGEVSMVNIVTKEKVLLYKTTNQTKFGPGLGAVTFSPKEEKVLFLAGIKNADEKRPYAMTRRTGIAIDVKNPLVAIDMDARDIDAPFTAGALRGGTHAHTWSGNGKYISFTYNDYVLQESEKLFPEVKDLRTIGVMFPKKVEVNNADGAENISGQMFSILLAKVIANPKPGTEEISKAFDECWIGDQGYIKNDGTRQELAIAYQGLVRDPNGKDRAEIFVVDVPADLAEKVDQRTLLGTAKTLPEVPSFLIRRQITHTSKGVSLSPRHWLRATADGKLIGFLAEDEKGIVQVYGVSPNGGAIKQLTFLSFSVSSPINFSPDGKHIAFIADDSIFIGEVKTGKTLRAIPKQAGLRGAVVWSPSGKQLCYNKYVPAADGTPYLQIFLLTI